MESTDKIIPAFVAAQAEFPIVDKSAKNNFIGSAYADLPTTVQAIRGALTKHGLAYSIVGNVDRLELNDQLVKTKNGEFAQTFTQVSVILRLFHESGQTMDLGHYAISCVNDPHGIGGAMTYLHRYALNAGFGLASDDDDGNAAMGNRHGKRPNHSPGAGQLVTPQSLEEEPF